MVLWDIIPQETTSLARRGRFGTGTLESTWVKLTRHPTPLMCLAGSARGGAGGSWEFFFHTGCQKGCVLIRSAFARFQKFDKRGCK